MIDVDFDFNADFLNFRREKRRNYEQLRILAEEEEIDAALEFHQLLLFLREHKLESRTKRYRVN